MSKNWIMLTGLLFLGAVGTSQAHPLDSPDIIYIDGLPCNSACQSYMAWSRRKMAPVAEHSIPDEPSPVASPPSQAAPEKPALRPAKSAVSRAAAVHRDSPKPAKRRIAKQAAPLPAAPAAQVSPPAAVAPPQLAGQTAVTSEPAPTNVASPPAETSVASVPAESGVAASPSVDGAAAASDTRTVQEQVAAATAIAEQVTAASAAPAPRDEATNAEASVRGEAAEAGTTEPAASAATDKADDRVALVMALPEIQSVSDLAGRDVAVADEQSASSASIRAAIEAAGAAEVQLNEKNVKTVDRLVGGEVPAAVVALVSPEAAAWFPEIPGYRIFRIPLSPGSLKARL